jgi:hypothetical protein
MKPLMLAGALAGFLTALAAGYSQQVPWPALLWRASLAAYLTCLLFGWWGKHWSRNLQLAVETQPAPDPQNPVTPVSSRP